ncbi:MAG: hypothetical protein HOI29_05640 [Planctomycetes bacterium]|nr:hypothetical protein [Planctomycetota bacterium]MBT6540679.1 hypothetical protein [Planctomycetota bacterium]MBT6784017.1 hypothetical protein [Planctomycetota bacterium]MBT6967760.1 hypothetical protein [Planctomycetota bacterium]MBT7104350.1 hypothetical protein [Planctomycetota bacterium]
MRINDSTAFLLFVVMALGLAAAGFSSIFSNIFSGNDTPPAASTTQDLQARIGRLEAEVGELRSAALSHLEESKGIGPPVEQDQSDLERRLAALEAMVAPLAASSGGVPGELISAEEIERTRRALTEVRRDEMDTKIAGWIDNERAKSERLLSVIEEKMKLPWQEQQRVREIMTSEADSHAQILEQMWSVEPPTNRAEEEAIAADWDLATTRMKEIRQERDEELQGLLGEERFDQLLDVVRVAHRPSNGQEKP